MKTTIFNMTFTLPPLVEMHEVEKDMPMNMTFTVFEYCGRCFRRPT